MDLRRINWMYLFSLPLAGGITLCLALLIQIIVSAEFEVRQKESKASILKIEDNSFACGCGNDGPAPLPHGRYETLSAPMRLEPDKSCEARLAKEPRRNYIRVNMSNIWMFDPERAASIEHLKKENAEKDKQDKCPLILKS